MHKKNEIRIHDVFSVQLGLGVLLALKNHVNVKYALKNNQICDENIFFIQIYYNKL